MVKTTEAIEMRFLTMVGLKISVSCTEYITHWLTESLRQNWYRQTV